MLGNLFARQDSGTLSLPKIELAALASAPKLDAALEPDIRFKHHSWKLTDEDLKELLPPFDEHDEAAWTFLNLIRKNLERDINSSYHSIADTRDRVYTVAGTALLAGEGFVNNPQELLAALAERYSRMTQTKVDQSMVQRLMGSKIKFTVAWEERKFTIWPQDKTEKDFTIEVSGSAFDACFRPSTFLRVPRFDRRKFYELAVGALETLKELNDEAFETYHSLLTSYEGAYNRWMFGS